MTSIGNSAFSGATNLTSIIFTNNVTSIGDSAFNGTPKLKSIRLPNGITRIGNSAFQSSGIDFIIVPITVDTIGDVAFGDDAVFPIILPRLQSAGINMFYNSGGQIYIYDVPTNTYKKSGYTNAGYNSGFTINENSSFLYTDLIALYSNITESGLIYAGYPTGPTSPTGPTENTGPTDSTSAIGSTTFTLVDGTTKSLNIVGGLSQTSYNNDLGLNDIKFAVIGSNVTSILQDAFQNANNLVSIDIPSSVKIIGISSLSSSQTISSIHFIDDATTYNITLQLAFLWNTPRMKSIQLPDRVVIETNAFDHSSIEIVYMKQITLDTLNTAATNSGDPQITFSTNQSFYGKTGVTIQKI